jgi:hypothetical protein
VTTLCVWGLYWEEPSMTLTADFFFFFSLIYLPHKQHNLSRDRSYLSPYADSIHEVNNRPVYYSQRLSYDLQLGLLVFCVVLWGVQMATVSLGLEQTNVAVDWTTIANRRLWLGISVAVKMGLTQIERQYPKYRDN